MRAAVAFVLLVDLSETLDAVIGLTWDQTQGCRCGRLAPVCENRKRGLFSETGARRCADRHESGLISVKRRSCLLGCLRSSKETSPSGKLYKSCVQLMHVKGIQKLHRHACTHTKILHEKCSGW